MAPSRAMKPNGTWVTSSPKVMPMATKGMTAKIMIGGRKVLKSITMINVMITIVGAMPGSSACWDSSELLYSPSHSSVYPGGSSMASKSASIESRKVVAVTPSGEACTLMARRRSQRQINCSSHSIEMSSMTCDIGTALVDRLGIICTTSSSTAASLRAASGLRTTMGIRSSPSRYCPTVTPS